MSRRLPPLFAGLALVALAFVTHHRVLDLAMLGWDGWPLVAASRVSTLGDLVGTFGEELMDGRYPYGHFYRPITHLSFALDEAVSGLDPAGYHRTDVLLLAGCAVLLAALVRRLSSGWAGFLAGVLFVLHPVQLELVSIPARRADTLALGFGLACLLTQVGGGEASRGRRCAAFLLAALAAGSKETGVWIAPAVLGWHLAHGSRLRAAVARSLPAWAGVALYVGARTLVLGGLGGHEGQVDHSTARLARGLLTGALPPPFAEASLGWAVAATLALTAGAWCVRRHEARALAVLAAMALSILLPTTLADRFHPWYAALLAAPLSGWVAVLAVRGARLSAAGRTTPGVAAVLLAVLACAGPLRHTPLLAGSPRLAEADRVLARSLDRLEAALDDTPPGGVARLPNWPIGLGGEGEGIALAEDYTVNAYLELHRPELRARAERRGPVLVVKLSSW